MGTMTALGMAAEVAKGTVDADQALLWHLNYNHYPYNRSGILLDAAKKAIALANDEDWDARVDLPEGMTWKGQATAPVHALVEDFHLESFLDLPDGDWEEDDGYDPTDEHDYDDELGTDLAIY